MLVRPSRRRHMESLWSKGLSEFVEAYRDRKREEKKQSHQRTSNRWWLGISGHATPNKEVANIILITDKIEGKSN